MTPSKIYLPHTPEITNTTIPLASSKSESNRALIIKSLSQNVIELSNLAEARDTQTMLRLLSSDEETLDVLDAGTTMRFLTAFCTATNRTTILTGTDRMKQRPIGILVDALKELGADIEFLENEGYPPHKIHGFNQKVNAVSIRGDVSSQYISALLMIAPTLPQGLSITLTGEIGSMPYITMTLALMERFGIQHEWVDSTIKINNQEYLQGEYIIESDWSGASYWYSLVALSKNGNLRIKGLRKNSLQGDSAIVEIMAKLGVNTVFDGNDAILSKKQYNNPFEYDFTNCPDLAQTISVICAAKGINAELSGLKSLRIKETDRIAAIQNELGRIGIHIDVIGDEAIHIPKAAISFSNETLFRTYEDHRMAMAFAPLCCLHSIQIEEPEVVNKSYPSFWKHFELVGIKGTVG